MDIADTVVRTTINQSTALVKTPFWVWKISVYSNEGAGPLYSSKIPKHFKIFGPIWTKLEIQHHEKKVFFNLRLSLGWRKVKQWVLKKHAKKIKQQGQFQLNLALFGNLTKMDTKHREERGTSLRYMLLNSPNGKVQIQPNMTHNSLW